MTEPNIDIKSKNLLFVALALLIFGAIWMFYPGELLANWIQNSWEKWFGVPWHKNLWRAIALTSTAKFGPTAIAAITAYWLAETVSRRNFSVTHRANIQKLDQARKTLRQGISSLEEIEREYRGKLSSFEKIQKEIDELKSVKEIDTADLQRKLNAISKAGRSNRYFERFLGFATGVVSSLIASYIWTKF